MATLPSSRSLLRAVVVFGGAQVFTLLSALVRTKVAALTIGPTGVGLNATYTTFSNLLATLFGCGLSQSAVPVVCEAPDESTRQRKVAELRGYAVVLSLLALPLSWAVAENHHAGDGWLALAVVSVLVMGIEMSVLKALHATRCLTTCILLTALVSLVCPTVCFVVYGLQGVLGAVVGTSLLAAVVTLTMSLRTCPVSPLLPCRRTLRACLPWFSLGLAFLLSSAMAYGTDLVLQRWFEHHATLATVGLYKAGYQLSLTYTGMVFSAVGNDFFPQLSSTSSDVTARNALITRQIRVLLTVTVPLIALFVCLAPHLVPLLFSHDFYPIIPMVRLAALAIVCRAVFLPMAYLPVVLQRKVHYLGLEAVSWGVIGGGVIVGYLTAGFQGVGAGICLASVVELLCTYFFCRHFYHFRFSLS